MSAQHYVDLGSKVKIDGYSRLPDRTTQYQDMSSKQRLTAQSNTADQSIDSYQMSPTVTVSPYSQEASYLVPQSRDNAATADNYDMEQNIPTVDYTTIATPTTYEIETKPLMQKYNENSNGQNNQKNVRQRATADPGHKYLNEPLVGRTKSGPATKTDNGLVGASDGTKVDNGDYLTSDFSPPPE